MLRVAAATIFLCFLPSQVNGLIKTNAKCLAGYDWTFSSIGQSPCDVWAELASVCVAEPYNLDPLPAGSVYPGPSLANQTICRCNSVTYSLLSACAYCQGRDHLQWSIYYANCTVLFLTIYTKPIPVGVKVPAYAFQDVSISNTFNVTLAQNTKGTESSLSPSSSTRRSSSTQIPTGTRNNGGNMSVNDTASIVGGVVGGIVALGLIAALITFIVLRSKRKPTPRDHNSGIRQRRNMMFVPDTPASLIRSTMSPPPGSPHRAHKATRNKPITDPSTDPMKSPTRQHSPLPLKRDLPTPDPTENTPQQDSPPLIPEHTGRTSHNTGKSEK